MSATIFTLKETPPQRCDFSALIPGRTANVDEMERIEIQTTKERLRVGDLFRVTPGDEATLRFEGGSERFDCVGANMSGGRIEVIGDVGQMLGVGMRGGAIAVSGNAGRLAGAEMIGGRIEISGDAGDLAGGPLAGGTTGMRGGVIHIQGNAGERAGDRMRRGLLVVGGRAGSYLASRMIGGTVVCFGEARTLPGYLMRRGTIILGSRAEFLSPTFINTGAHELVAMRLLARWLIEEGIAGGSQLAATMRRLVGDTAIDGRGEIFLPA